MPDTPSPWSTGFRIARFEAEEVVGGTSWWVALAVLVFFLLGVKGLFAGQFMMNGQEVGQQARLVYFLGVGYSVIVFLSTLYGLSVCVERTGASFLRGNDLLLMARSVSRSVFYFGKLGGAFVAAALFSVIALVMFWLALFWYSGVNLYALLLLAGPQLFGLSAVMSLFFWMRLYLGNVTVFFLWLAFLPFSYATNLWYYYGAALREASTTGWSWIGFLPQFGGMHAFSLGVVQEFYYRTEAWLAVANLGLWTLLALVAGAMRFRKRLL